jgi:uncharacterized protein DUF4440
MRILLVAAILVSGCGSYFARREVMAGNERVYRAIRDRDINTLRTLATDDFRWDHPDGKPRNRDEWLAGVAATPGQIQSVTGSRLKLERRADRLVLCGVQRAVVQLDGKELVDDQAYCNDWMLRDGRWQIVESYVPTF